MICYCCCYTLRKYKMFLTIFRRSIYCGSYMNDSKLMGCRSLWNFVRNHSTTNVNNIRSHSQAHYRDGGQGSTVSSSKERIICVDGRKLNVREEGEGSHNVLCLPGLMGSIETDFGKIFKNMNKTKFRLIGWDPPGYGKSLPHDRIHDPDFYLTDALLAARLMEELGYKSYSLLGWSNGGMTGFTLAAQLPERITRLVMFGAHAYWDKSTRKRDLKYSNVQNWSNDRKETLLKVYDENYLKSTSDNFGESVEELCRSGKDSVFKERIQSVQCPALALHGENDLVLLIDHAHYFVKHMKNCKLQFIRDGNHDLHLTHTKQFLSHVEKFLLEEH